AQEWTTLRQVLTEITTIGDDKDCIQVWADIRYRTEGSYSGYIADLELLWRWADEQQDVVLSLRCALIGSSLRSLAHSIPPLLLPELITFGTPKGFWSVPAVLNHIRFMAPAQQVQAIEALLSKNISLPFDVVLEIVGEIKTAEHASKALV